MDEHSDDVDDTPLADRISRKRKNEPKWRKTTFAMPESDSRFTGPQIEPPASMEVQTPFQYFKQFVMDDMLESLVTHTNEYSVQKSGNSVNTNKKEVEQVIGMFFHMGLVRMSGVRQYWESATAYSPVCSAMSRNRFQLLLTMLHFVNNLLVSSEDKKDKLWKIRPWLARMRENCLKLVPEEHCSIDEMMCQYRGKTSPIRQYIKGKPHPWGFKSWCRAGVSGILYDFEVYQGGDGKRSELGQGADVVLKLASTLVSHVNYKLYADNLFTSLNLLLKLKERGIHYTGTVRKNRLAGCTMREEKTLMKSGRGSYDHRVEQNNNIVAVRWLDNKVVTLFSTLTGIEPLGSAKRWDKKKKAYVEVPMPAVIDQYNKHMGGIDLLDSFLAQYRFKMKSRRWYLYLFWHFLMVALVNAWNVYRQEYKLLGLPVKNMMNRRNFQASVASSLVKVNSKGTVGRPSTSRSPLQSPQPPRKKQRLPDDDVRKDGYCHWPKKIEKRGRCKLCEVNNTNTVCTKCEVRLCFVEDRNCFYDFHQ